jgi:hypothetical protein
MSDIESMIDRADEEKKRRRENEFEAYLGDGLYARFDGWHVILTAPRLGGDHFVGLEPEVLVAFEKWLKQVRAARHAT